MTTETMTATGAVAGLYLASLAIETATALIRLIVIGGPIALIARGIDSPVLNPLAPLAVVYFSFGPVLLSLLALAGLPGGALERFALGARQPSQRERHAIHDALTSLPARGRAPRRIYVIDLPDLNAFVIGDVLYINRPLTQDHHLAAVIAHELAHLGTDGRLTLALRRFCLPIGRPPGVLAGGLSQRLLAQPWLAWWRHREHRADQHAAVLGLGDELADLLERTQLLDAAAPFMRDRTHPYTEHRIERLRRAGPRSIAEDATR